MVIWSEMAIKPRGYRTHSTVAASIEDIELRVPEEDNIFVGVVGPVPAGAHHVSMWTFCIWPAVDFLHDTAHRTDLRRQLETLGCVTHRW